MNGRSILRLSAALALAHLCANPALSAPRWTVQASGTTERLRAVRAVSEQIAWASGNHGAVLRTLDGGRNWQSLQVPDAGELDFRDVEAFDAHTAWVLSAGSGANSRIYKTVDGGAHWTVQFINREAAGFYDAMAFWDRDRGLAFGDPVAGRYTVIRTEDGGRSWTPAPPEKLPLALPGESAFAASGGCLTVQGKSNAWFGTGGGARARIFRSRNGGLSWQAADTPLLAGRDSAGVFAVAFSDALRGIAVGGDYRKVNESNVNLAHTTDGGRSWTPMGATRLPGFRSSVAFIPGSQGLGLMTVGPAGSDWSADGGATWIALDGEGLHALALTGATHAHAGWAVGENGRIVKLSAPDKPLPPTQQAR